MKILWESEDWPGARIEPGISCLTWLPNSDRPSHGLLGVGSSSGAVGITATNLFHCEDDNGRYNYNLRGHHSPINMVTWNKAQSKLASCDSGGVIYVWVRNEDRWSVELVNDRGVKVKDLCWSPCGGSALICYEDNFVLIGSSIGTRVWSNSFSNGVLSGVWSPDSQHFLLGFATGSIQVLSEQGASVTERSFGISPINKLSFSPTNNGKWTLAILVDTYMVLMINEYDQVDPFVFKSQYDILQFQWNADGTLLALITENNELRILDTKARCVHREVLNATDKGLTAFTWAHDGHSIIIASGGSLSVGRILHGVPSLFKLVTYSVWRIMGSNAAHVDRLPVPVKEKSALRELDHHIIRCRIPRNEELTSYVCSVSDSRTFCTIKPFSRGSHSYVLCMEHMGGLVPLLIGRQVNRFLPQFHISLHDSALSSCHAGGGSAQVEDVSIISRPSPNRNSLWRRSKRQLRALMSRHVRTARSDYRLVQVSSNVWCTRFSITSLAPLLPDFLGQVVYKTSVLHLQPRQMTIDLSVLTGDSPLSQSDSKSCEDVTETVDETSRLIDNGLTKEERAFFDRVVNECTSLRAAMDGTVGTSSQVAAAKYDSPPSEWTSSSAQTQQTCEDASLSTMSTWHDEIESLEYIDGEDEREALLSTTSSSAFSNWRRKKGGSSAARKEKEWCENEEIKANLDRLAKTARQLSHRHADFNVKRDISNMRSQMKELLRRVDEIERKVGCDDVKTEVRQLMRTLEEMKKALGEDSSGIVPSNRVITMHNKTPFWNEHNQVYQLDFGGRVTQESAKNFQVELDQKQVLQFGRIEGGAYTLDFRKPFSACQAFAVALASITQRLK